MTMTEDNRAALRTLCIIRGTHPHMAIIGVSSVRSKAHVNLFQERAGIDKCGG
jgi:hypothetical protein